MITKKVDLTENRMTRQVFYADVRMSREILANEWDKKIFLTSLENAGALLRTQVYAFCVLNDRIRILSGGKDVKSRTVRRVLVTAFERFERETELIGEKNLFSPGTTVHAKILRIDDEKDAVAVLRYIHLTPFSEGYTICAQDYWWTSYSTYRGHYNWTLLDTAPVMRYLSRHDSRPVHTLSEYHRRGEILHNPIPSCIEKGEFEPLPSAGPDHPQGNINETFMVHI